MELGEAANVLQQLVNSYKGVKRLEEVLDFAVSCRQQEVELTLRIEKLRKECFELDSLKAAKERLETEVRDLEKQKYSAQVALDSLKADRENLKKNIEEIIG